MFVNSSSIKLILVSGYVFFSVLWLVLLDSLLMSFTDDLNTLLRYKSYSSWFFIILTTMFLYILMRWFPVNKKKDSIFKERSRQLDSLTKSLPGVVYRCSNDSDWTMKYLSDNCFELTGYNPEDFINNNILSYGSIIHPDDYEKVRDIFKENEKNREPVQVDYRIIKSDGSESWVLEVAGFVCDEKNNIKFIEGVILNDSGRKEANERDIMLSSVFQVIPDLLFIMKRDGTIIDYRAQVNSDLYVPPEIFLNKRMQDVLPEATGKIFENHIQDISEDGTLNIFEYELEVEHEKKIFEARIAKLPTHNHILTIIRDISEGIEYQQQLAFQSELLEQSLAATDVVDENANFIYVNDAYVKMWGYDTQNEILGTSPISHCIDPDMPKKIIERVEKELASLFEFKARRKDGSVFDVLMAVNIIKFKNKKFYVGSSLDITELRKNQKMILVQSRNAAMGEMLGNIAHQWRQPLSAITTASTGAKIQKEMDCLTDKQLDSVLDSVNKSAQYLSQTIDDFRSFFNPSNNKISRFNIPDTVRKTLNIITAQFVAKDIEIVKNLEEIEILSIENELIQVLINILNNAKDVLIAKVKGRRLIFINAYKKDNSLIIEIKDNGKGIPEEIAEKVFEPYFTTKHKSQGTGIGLYMSQEIITNHLNGTLIVENEEYIYESIKYIGAEFIIEIPLD